MEGRTNIQEVRGCKEKEEMEGKSSNTGGTEGRRDGSKQQGEDGSI